MSDYFRPGYKSGFPEAVTPELDEFYFHLCGGSPGAPCPHDKCGDEHPCPYGDDIKAAERELKVKATGETK